MPREAACRYAVPSPVCGGFVGDERGVGKGVLVYEIDRDGVVGAFFKHVGAYAKPFALKDDTGNFFKRVSVFDPAVLFEDEFVFGYAQHQPVGVDMQGGVVGKFFGVVVFLFVYLGMGVFVAFGG